ncbi:hypothetical protein WA026_022438 [Henosepilachna vigintioctopunctata]|uniref:Reticulon-like protein n=1 Tax=Henosepilachna vigintioctopunctata TaxID=420089 RepID=A0AAW1UCW5_9CUCU
MEYIKKSVTISNGLNSEEKPASGDENSGFLNSTTNACLSAFKLVENTVDDSVNAVVSCSSEVVKTVEDAGKECVNVVEQGAKLVKDGIDLTETGVDNIMRLISMCRNVYRIILKYKHYLETDSMLESTMALAFWIFACYIFQVWMIPVFILVILVKNFIQRQLLGIPAADVDKMLNENNKETSIIEKLEAVEKIILAVKHTLGKVELILGKIFDIFDVYLPQFFWIVVLIQIVLTAILMYIPLNYLIMLWGISLYAKRFSKDNATNTNKKSVGGVPKRVSFSTVKRAVPDTMSKLNTHSVSDKIVSKCD